MVGNLISNKTLLNVVVFTRWGTRTVETKCLHNPFPSAGVHVESVRSFSCLNFAFFRGSFIGLDDYNVFKLWDTCKCGV
jgi:hypothetical protein